MFFALQRVPGDGLQSSLLFVTTCQNEDSSNNEFQIHTTTKILDWYFSDRCDSFVYCKVGNKVHQKSSVRFWNIPTNKLPALLMHGENIKVGRFELNPFLSCYSFWTLLYMHGNECLFLTNSYICLAIYILWNYFCFKFIWALLDRKRILAVLVSIPF